MPVLNKRLILAAELLGKQKAVVDVGTDHAFLPIYMVKNGFTQKVIACDIAKSPLSVAEDNIKKYHLENNIELRLANGLSAISSCECTGITITGMGGETISQIIDRADWLFVTPRSHTLVLQPMSCDDRLREYLNNKGFEIIKEKAVVSQGRIYTLIKAEYIAAPPKASEEFVYIGKLLENPTDLEITFVEKRLKSINKCIREIAEVERKKQLYNHLTLVRDKIELALKESKG